MNINTSATETSVETDQLVRALTTAISDDTSAIENGGLTLPAPDVFRSQMPLQPTAEALEMIEATRTKITSIMSGEDSARMMILGPCSPDFRGLEDGKIPAVVEFAKRIKSQIDEIQAKHDVLVILRTPAVKPRTAAGWAGIWNDSPSATRILYTTLVNLGIPIATEVYGQAQQDYLGDLCSITWVGARNVLAPNTRGDLAFTDHPVLVKHSQTDIESSFNARAVLAANQNTTSVDWNGGLTLKKSPGNQNTLTIMRGYEVKGRHTSNIDKDSIKEAHDLAVAAGLNTGVVIDVSHSNGNKTVDGALQSFVKVLGLLDDPQAAKDIKGVMIEAYLGGKGDEYGESMTDPTVSVDATIKMMSNFAKHSDGDMPKTNLHEVHEKSGQSMWLDNLSRPLIQTGELATLVATGVRGVTSNPSIFQKAMQEGTAYDHQLDELKKNGFNAEDAYWELVIKDISDACDVLKPLHEESGGEDGFVSVEVDPRLAHDTQGTIKQAIELHDQIARENVMIKVPATKEGLPAISALIARGISVNVTLIFSLERYQEVINAYMLGLEQNDSDISKVRSVASFFVSRVDAVVDEKLDDDSPLRGEIALALARSAYGVFLDNQKIERWSSLLERGAHVQRPLWASTSVKNPDYSDTKYLDGLVSKDTVNTVPPATLDAFIESGQPEGEISESDVQSAQKMLDQLHELGIDITEITNDLESAGVQQFIDSFNDPLKAIENR